MRYKGWTRLLHRFSTARAHYKLTYIALLFYKLCLEKIPGHLAPLYQNLRDIESPRF